MSIGEFDSEPARGAPPHGNDAELLELSRQLRLLARHLAPDDATADDLVQEAWLAALQSPPDRLRDLTTWLRGVVRNLARRKLRKARMRGDAEREAAASEQVSSEVELIERLSIHRALRARVEDLREPSRTVLRMRYFEELTPPEIAAALGRPLETVRTQLQRGLDELRAALQRSRHADGTSWSLALLAWLRKRRGERRSLRSAAWIAVAVGLVVLTVIVTRDAPTTGPRTTASAAGVALGGEATADQRVDRQDATAARAPADPPSANGPAGPVPTQPQADAQAGRSLRVLVVDPTGAPAPSATVRAFGLDKLELGQRETDSDGRCEFELDAKRLLGPPWLAKSPGGVALVAHAQGWSYSFELHFECPVEGRDVVVQLGERAQRIVGRTLDDSGEGLAGVRLELLRPGSDVRALADGTPYTDTDIQGISDADGRFVLDHLPRREHYISAHAYGFLSPFAMLEGAEDELEVEFTLYRGTSVIGRVTLPDGSAAAGARVWRPHEQGNPKETIRTTADDTGRFELPGLSRGANRVFASAAEDDALFAETVIDFADLEEATWAPILQPSTPLFVRVESHDGRPLTGALVLLRTSSENQPAWAELRRTTDDGRARFAHQPQGMLECMASSDVLGAPSPPTRLAARASSEIVLRMPESMQLRFVRASVLDHLGAPLSEARAMAYSVDAPNAMPSRVDVRGGVLEDLRLARGTYELYILAMQGVFDAGAVVVDGESDLDLGVLTAPVPVSIELERHEETTGLACSVVGVLSHTTGNRVDITMLTPQTNNVSLWPGAYEIRTLSRSGERLLTGFDVALGQPARIELP